MQKQMKAGSLGNRCIALIIDGFISGILCFGCLFYSCWKDGIRNGQSFGKGMMGLKVVKMNGESAKVFDSCLRNICMLPPIGWICCFFNNEGRHFGDLVAGTMVVEDS